jgi:Kdo2-lipid IVA lauroyltransferase/acyltransferase
MTLDYRLLAPRHWAVWLGIAVMALFGNLPGALGRPLGRMIGRLFKVLGRARVRVARRNLELCFPELDSRSRERLLHQSFLSIGEGSYEFARAWWGRARGLRVDHVEGLEVLEALRQQGRGVLLLSGHFLTLEICGRLLCDHIRLAGFYRRHEQPPLEWAVKRGRARYAAAMFAREELRAAVKYVKQGGVLWYAPDQDIRGKDSVFAPFFGITANSFAATHHLARLTGAAVVPFFHHRDGRGGYSLRIGTPLENFPTADVVADTAAVNALIEQMVREAPSEYLWIHKRFKTRPEGEPRIY